MITRLKAQFFKPFIAVAIMSAMFTSCDKDDEEKTMYTISGTASGAQEVPVVTTSGTGTVSGTFDKNTKILNYNVSWSGLSGNATMAHFHGPADPGKNAKVLIPIPITSALSGTATGSVSLPDSTATFFMEGKMYYNVHTPANPGGEVRAQVTMK